MTTRRRGDIDRPATGFTTVCAVGLMASFASTCCATPCARDASIFDVPRTFPCNQEPTPQRMANWAPPPHDRFAYSCFDERGAITVLASARYDRMSFENLGGASYTCGHRIEPLSAALQTECWKKDDRPSSRAIARRHWERIHELGSDEEISDYLFEHRVRSYRWSDGAPGHSLYVATEDPGAVCAARVDGEVCPDTWTVSNLDSLTGAPYRLYSGPAPQRLKRLDEFVDTAGEAQCCYVSTGYCEPDPIEFTPYELAQPTPRLYSPRFVHEVGYRCFAPQGPLMVMFERHSHDRVRLESIAGEPYACADRRDEVPDGPPPRECWKLRDIPNNSVMDDGTHLARVLNPDGRPQVRYYTFSTHGFPAAFCAQQPPMSPTRPCPGSLDVEFRISPDGHRQRTTPCDVPGGSSPFGSYGIPKTGLGLIGTLDRTGGEPVTCCYAGTCEYLH